MRITRNPTMDVTSLSTIAAYFLAHAFFASDGRGGSLFLAFFALTSVVRSRRYAVRVEPGRAR